MLRTGPVLGTLMTRTILFFILEILTVMSSAQPSDPLTCSNALTADENNFALLLRQEKWQAARQKLAHEKREVTYALQTMSKAEFSRLSRHWSALYTESGISSDLKTLKHISDEMQFEPNSLLVDIGCGHGDPGLVFAALNPTLHVIGYDIVKEKVDSANRTAEKLGLRNVQFIVADFSESQFRLPLARYYYLFNPAKEEVIHSIAEQLIEHSNRARIDVISYGNSLAWTTPTLIGAGIPTFHRSTQSNIFVHPYSKLSR